MASEFRRVHQLLGVKSRVEERVAGIIFANVLLDSDGLSRQEKGHEISKIVSAVGPGFIMRMLQTTDPKMLTMKAALQLLAHACLSSSQLVLFAPHIDDFVRFILSYGEAAPRPAEAAEATSKAKATKDDGREQTLLQALIILQYVAASSADLHLLPTLHSLLRGATGTFAFPVLLLETSVQLLRHRLLNTRPASKAAAEQVLGSHASALRSLVVQCMHGLAPAETRRRALECLLQLLLLRPLGLGADWTVEEKQAFKDASTGPPSQGGEGKGQGQFALLVCAVLRGEMHIVAEGILALEGARVEPLSSSRGVSQANADGAAEPSALVAKKRTCLVCCLVFAHMLPLLVGDGEDEGGGDGEGGEEGPWAALPPSVLEGVRRQGHSIVQDGLSVLGECAALLQQQQQQQQDKQQQDKQQDKQQESARELRAFASALTATLCRWCSEDEALHAPLLDSLDAVLACSAVAGLARGREEEQLERVWGVLSCRGESASEWGAAEEAVLLMLGELGAPEGAGLGMGRGEDLLHRLLPTLLSMQEPGGDDDDEEEEEEEEDDEGGGEVKASSRRTTQRLSHSPALAARLLTIVTAAAHCTPGVFAGLCDALGSLGRAAMAVEEEEREAAGGTFPQLEALVMCELARASREHAQGREGGERQRQWVAGVQTAQIAAAQLALLLPALGLQATHHTPLKSSLPSPAASATVFPTRASLSAAQASLRASALQGKLLAKRLLLGCAACLLRSPPAPPGRGDEDKTDGSQGGVEEFFGLLHALEHVSKSVTMALA